MHDATQDTVSPINLSPLQNTGTVHYGDRTVTMQQPGPVGPAVRQGTLKGLYMLVIKYPLAIRLSPPQRQEASEPLDKAIRMCMYMHTDAMEKTDIQQKAKPLQAQQAPTFAQAHDHY